MRSGASSARIARGAHRARRARGGAPPRRISRRQLRKLGLPLKPATRFFQKDDTISSGQMAVRFVFFGGCFFWFFSDGITDAGEGGFEPESDIHGYILVDKLPDENIGRAIGVCGNKQAAFFGFGFEFEPEGGIFTGFTALCCRAGQFGVARGFVVLAGVTDLYIRVCEWGVVFTTGGEGHDGAEIHES